MDKSAVYALVLGGVAFAAGVFRVVQRFAHISKYGTAEQIPESEVKGRAASSLQA